MGSFPGTAPGHGEGIIVLFSQVIFWKTCWLVSH